MDRETSLKSDECGIHDSNKNTSTKSDHADKSTLGSESSTVQEGQHELLSTLSSTDSSGNCMENADQNDCHMHIGQSDSSTGIQSNDEGANSQGNQTGQKKLQKVSPRV